MMQNSLSFTIPKQNLNVKTRPSDFNGPQVGLETFLPGKIRDGLFHGQKSLEGKFLVGHSFKKSVSCQTIGVHFVA